MLPVCVFSGPTYFVFVVVLRVSEVFILLSARLRLFFFLNVAIRSVLPFNAGKIWSSFCCWVHWIEFYKWAVTGRARPCQLEFPPRSVFRIRSFYPRKHFFWYRANIKIKQTSPQAGHSLGRNATARVYWGISSGGEASEVCGLELASSLRVQARGWFTSKSVASWGSLAYGPCPGPASELQVALFSLCHHYFKVHKSAFELCSLPHLDLWFANCHFRISVWTQCPPG